MRKAVFKRQDQRAFKMFQTYQDVLDWLENHDCFYFCHYDNEKETNKKN